MKKTPLLLKVKQYIKSFCSLLSNPQSRHFVTVLDGMLSKEKKSILKFSKNGFGRNQSSVNRFFNSVAVDDVSLTSKANNHLVLNLEDSNLRLLIIDDTFCEHKYSQKMFGVSKDYDNSKKKYNYGHRLVTSGIAQNDIFYPGKILLHQNKKGVSGRNYDTTKIEKAKTIISDYIKNVDYVVLDAWYASKGILNIVSKKGKYYCVALKSNRNIYTDNKLINLKNLISKISRKKYEKITVQNNEYLVYDKVVHLPNVGDVKIVLSRHFNKEKRKYGSTKCLATNNLDINAKEIISMYKDRWMIEVYHRDIKQNLGAEKFILRKEIAVKRIYLFIWLTQLLIASCKKIFNSSSGEIIDKLGELIRPKHKNIIKKIWNKYLGKMSKRLLIV